MKKLLLALLIVAMCVSSPSAKILLITSNGATDATAQYLMADFHRLYATQGWKYDRVLGNYALTNAEGDTIDSPYIMAQSGEYTEAIVLPLPMINTDAFNTEIELAAVGYPELPLWVNRNSSKPFPIRLIIPIPATLDTTTDGCWGRTISGQRGLTGVETLTAQPITDADGDSIYVVNHANAYARARVGTTDSISWCEPMIWQDKVVGANLKQKYCYMWRTIGAGNHEVVWVEMAQATWMQPLLAAAIALGEKVTPIDVPLLADNYGYVGSTATGTNSVVFGTAGAADTVSFAYNLHRLVKDYVVPRGIKLEFLVSTYQMDTQNKTNIKALTSLVAAYPDNLRMTHKTDYAWGVTSNRDWLGFADSGTPDQAVYLHLTQRIGRSIDSTASNGYDVSDDRLYGAVKGYYSGYSGSAARTDSTLLAIVDCGVSKIYVTTNAYTGGTIPTSGAQYFGITRSGKTWVGDAYEELTMYPLAGSLLSQGSIETNWGAMMDSARIYYLDDVPKNASRAVCDTSPLKLIMGQYVNYGGTILNTTSSIGWQETVHSGVYSPGLLLESGTIMGGSAATFPTYTGVDPTRSMFIDRLVALDEYISMANNLVTRYGDTGQPVFIYSWPDEVNLDRQLGKATINGHVRKI